MLTKNKSIKRGRKKKDRTLDYIFAVRTHDEWILKLEEISETAKLKRADMIRLLVAVLHAKSNLLFKLLAEKDNIDERTWR
jgi:hypothetical protein